MLKMKRAAALSVASVIALSSYAYAGTYENFKDIPDDWSNTAITAAIENGLLSGDNGYVNPQDKLTRAQMAAIITRAFGSTVQGDVSKFSDLKKDAWYFGGMAEAVQMGIFEGTDGKLMPDKNITRQEAMAVLARAFMLNDEDASVLSSYKDSDKVADWAKGSVAAMVKAGYVSGNDGCIDPEGEITRAQFAQIMYKMVPIYANKITIMPSEIDGNLMINTPDYTLENGVVKGDVIIGEGVGEGSVNIKNTKISGRVIVRGGGVNSINVTDSTITGEIVAERHDGPTHVDMDSNSTAGGVSIMSGTVNLDGNFSNVTLSGSANANLNSGTVGELVLNGAGAAAQVGTNAAVTSAVVNANASSSTITVNGSVGSMQVSAENVGVTGAGSVTSATISGDNTNFGISGTNLTVSDNTNGTTVNGSEVTGGTTGTTSTSGVSTTTTTTTTTKTTSGGGGGGGSSTTYYSVKVSAGTPYEFTISSLTKTDTMKSVALSVATKADGFAVAAQKTNTHNNLVKLENILSGTISAGDADIQSWVGNITSATSSVSKLTGTSLVDEIISDINDGKTVSDFTSKYGTLTVEIGGRDVSIELK
jgi:hypothetical protein